MEKLLALETKQFSWDEDQLNNAIALDGGITDKAWIIREKRQDGAPKKSTKEVLPRALISTIPNNKKEELIMTTVTSPIIIKDITTEEVVDTVNKYRKNLLSEKQFETISPPIKDYTSSDNVVKVIEEYREEIMVEYDKVALPVKANEADDKIRVYDENHPISKARIALFEKRVGDKKGKKSERSTNGEKTVSLIEIHEYNKVNADCTKRLPSQNQKYPFTFSNRNPFIIGPGNGFSSSSDDEEHIKEVKKCIKKKQGTRSDTEYEETGEGFRENNEIYPCM
uniref:Uncharacterized protein n=1 Tax=Rhizophagus irregularis (strain DAOM 181602 / DAOM 197198 / MUCL 43194) TaxID=747089 RepID=U9SN21_RHIID